MSQRVSRGIATVAGLLLAGVAAYWIHGWKQRERLALVSAAPSKLADSPKSREAAETLASGAPKKATPEPEAGLPLRIGEVLDYTANVGKITNVADLRVVVAGRRNFYGTTVWHLQAFAHTHNPLRMIFELDDQFDSYSDAANLTTVQYEMHLQERGHRVDSVERMTTTGKEPAPSNASETRVVPGTRDPLSLLGYLRKVDWTKTREVRSPVYDGHKLYDVRASFAGSERVSVAAGTFDTKKVNIQVFDNGQEMNNAHVLLYLAENEARTPVLLDTVMPFATARVELKSTD
jgi:hypothetical protein